MPEVNEYILKIFENDIVKAVISKPANKNCEYRKITIAKMSNSYQVAKYTEKQVFHENISADKIAERCVELIEGIYLQFNAWSESKEFSIMITKKGKVFYKAKNNGNQTVDPWSTTDRSNISYKRARLLNPLWIWVYSQKRARS